MNVKATINFSANIRQETVPELTEEQYTSLLSGESVSVSAVAGEYLIKYSYAVEDK